MNVDRCGETEIQNLGHDVHRQHIERDAGILAGEYASQVLHILRRGMVILAQLHLDVGVGWSDGRGGRVREVQSRVGQADVIDDIDHLSDGNLLSDGRVDVVAERGRFLDARAGAGAHVNLELAGVHRREEVLAEPRREQPDRTQCKRREQDQKDHGVVHAQGEQPKVAVAEVLKTGFEGQLKADERIVAGMLLRGFCVVVLLEQVHGHGGNQGA